jgi:hypothetical protein
MSDQWNDVLVVELRDMIRECLSSPIDRMCLALASRRNLKEHKGLPVLFGDDDNPFWIGGGRKSLRYVVRLLGCRSRHPRSYQYVYRVHEGARARLSVGEVVAGSYDWYDDDKEIIDVPFIGYVVALPAAKTVRIHVTDCDAEFPRIGCEIAIEIWWLANVCVDHLLVREAAAAYRLAQDESRARPPRKKKQKLKHADTLAD